ncbi:hypothetical protein [Hyalangium versicolor]|uniref:hypothetical protein n=1 Tax=Hyalangium versicolor TaxID=2861190 RepID=UPI001CC9A21F|nr:hypothetical protein [Hyalangium versicolor]
MLKPGLTLITTFALATGGCAFGTGAQRLEREGNASITGILVPPPNAVGPKSTSCAGVRIRVAHVREPSQLLGNVMVKASRQRCFYVVSSLPSEAELHLEVRPGADWKCENGQPPTLSPRSGSGTLKLRDYETATRDFRATCG